MTSALSLCALISKKQFNGFSREKKKGKNEKGEMEKRKEKKRGERKTGNV